MAAAQIRGDRTPGGGDRGARTPGGGGGGNTPIGPREMEFHDTGPFAETTDLYHFPPFFLSNPELCRNHQLL